MQSVLVVEDDLLIASMLQDALECDGYSVMGTVRTVDEAIHAIEQDAPDFAIIDLRLADGRRGTEVGAYLRKTTDTAIVYSTGNDSNELTTLVGDAVMMKPYGLYDVGVCLSIVREIAKCGRTDLRFPHNFRMLTPTRALAQSWGNCFAGF